MYDPAERITQRMRLPSPAPATLLAACLMTCLVALTPTALRAQTIRTLDGHKLTPASIDLRVNQLMQANHVQGLAVALIRNGRVVYLHAYGERNAAGQPLTPGTLMYGASLTKATFAYMVMQLVDEGKVDLDRSIADYLPQPLPSYPNYADLAHDPRWRQLTFRILLDHSTGFANFRWIEPDSKLQFHSDPGSVYGYSGEGLQLAQFVLEKGLGLNVADEMQRRVFDRFGMAHTDFIWTDGIDPEMADVFYADGSVHPHAHKRHVSAAGSMDTTPRDWSAFLAAVVRGDGLSPKAKAEMIHQSIAISSSVQFPTLGQPATDAYKPIHLGYGIGWGVFDTPYGHAFFKEGHDDGTANYALCVQPKQACILLLSNSDHAEGIYKYLVDDLLGPTNLPWRWENYIPYDQPAAAAH